MQGNQPYFVFSEEEEEEEEEDELSEDEPAGGPPEVPYEPFADMDRVNAREDILKHDCWNVKYVTFTDDMKNEDLVAEKGGYYGWPEDVPDWIHQNRTIGRYWDRDSKKSWQEKNIEGGWVSKYLHAYGIPIFGQKSVPEDSLRRMCYAVRWVHL